MSLTAARNTVMLADKAEMLYLPVGAGKKIYQGAIVVLNAGYAEAGNKAENLIAAGRAEETVDNTEGSAGDVYINVRRGVFIFDNDSTTANKVKPANLLGDCYVLDDSTVTALATGASKAGKIVDISNDGVAVEIV